MSSETLTADSGQFQPTRFQNSRALLRVAPVSFPVVFKDDNSNGDSCNGPYNINARIRISPRLRAYVYIMPMMTMLPNHNITDSLHHRIIAVSQTGQQISRTYSCGMYLP